MKKVLFAIFSVLFIGLYIPIVPATHYGVPTVGQERTEIVWVCANIDDARTFVTARAEVEDYYDWIDILRALISQGRCKLDKIEYEVEEIVEIVLGLYVENREFGEQIPHYIVKSNNHFVVTY